MVVGVGTKPRPGLLDRGRAQRRARLQGQGEEAVRALGGDVLLSMTMWTARGLFRYLLSPCVPLPSTTIMRIIIGPLTGPLAMRMPG